MSGNIYAYVVNVVVQKQNNNFYAFCPGIPAIHVSGFTAKEAIKEALESVINIIEIYHEKREPLPENKNFYALREPKPAQELAKDDVVVPIPPHIASALLNCEQRL